MALKRTHAHMIWIRTSRILVAALRSESSSSTHSIGVVMHSETVNDAIRARLQSLDRAELVPLIGGRQVHFDDVSASSKGLKGRSAALAFGISRHVH